MGDKRSKSCNNEWEKSHCCPLWLTGPSYSSGKIVTHAAFGDILMRLRERGKFTDVTLVCEGKLSPVDKLVVSACSEHLEQILENNECHHPTIVLHGIKCYDLEQLLMYMYTGEVSVP
ncbi:hypothetical protein Pmani_035720 [Petrolisthes manimaculis]|uniref:BTB domain-containing protein n=1 Tax=Petrolisthes manimaculis TaxID=1843537 RepID=A0AAE1NL50_9EUCA|nr:hypothetical protein Pmani_035720 [Petrolisthes manimaculis]